MFLQTLCPRSTHLTGVQLESVSAAAGRNPLAVLAVDLGALEAGDAAARLLRHGVLGPLHEALHCWFTLTISYIHPNIHFKQLKQHIQQHMGAQKPRGQSASI